MTKTDLILALLIALFVAAGCNTEDPELGSKANNINNVNNEELTKEKAREMGGVDENGDDLCEQKGWYIDNVCDDFCPIVDDVCIEEPDEDCLRDAECADAEFCRNGVCVPLDDTVCGGLTNRACPEGKFCQYDDGVCADPNEVRTCEDKPDACDDEYAPVCGCDGETYSNACVASVAGVSVMGTGPCAAQCSDANPCENGEVCVDGGCVADEACGGRAGNCEDDEYCAFELEDICGLADATAVCAPRPAICTDEYAPVCGCDGQVYSNECEAKAAGTARASDDNCELPCANNDDCGEGATCVNSACVADTGRCGGRGGAMCPQDEYCFYETAAICGAADALGTCSAIPTICNRLYAPVCGCDQTTYGNNCMAAAASVSVAADGPCGMACQANSECAKGESCQNGFCEPNTQCGGLQGLQCSDTFWCDYPETTVCGQADFFGVCRARPQACLQVYMPVCGCDGMTHGNACTAHANGTDVMAEGVCGAQ